MPELPELRAKRERLFYILGPCVIESADHAKFMAAEIAAIADRLGIEVIFKASYDKANRTSVRSPRGVGLRAGLGILADVRKDSGLPVTTDVHTVDEAKAAGIVCDLLQIPAMLSRQTDLIVAAARTGKAVNIKKSQGMAPADMAYAIEKAVQIGGPVVATERGTTFGYGNLVVDMRSIPIMQRFGPVVIDATHSTQLPGANGGASGGQRAFAPIIAAAAVAAGADGVFMEVHQDPDHAPSDGPAMVRLSDLETIILRLEAIKGAWR